MTGPEECDHFLLCQIGSRIVALALGDVRETMRPLPIEPLQGTQASILGLSIVRGVPVPVIDARLLLPSLRSVSESAARFVTLRLGERSAALAVDSVLEVRTIARGALTHIPPLLQEAGPPLAAIGALDAELLLVLQAARLLPESVWTAVGPSEALE